MKILIVDDLNPDIICHYLKHHNYLMANTVGEAIELLEEHEDIETAVIDYDLPNKMGDNGTPNRNGIELIKYIREHKLHVKTILITAYAMTELETEAYEAGADGFLFKPFNKQQLIELVD